LNSVLIDSDILIEVSRGRDAAVLAQWSQLALSKLPLFCSPVTVAEIWHGARPLEHAAITALFSVVQCVSIDLAIGYRAGEYLRRFARSHHVELGDALIAATASLHSLTLWTRKRRHYPMTDVAFY
jgi:predicted nucleic acid-binding protein